MPILRGTAASAQHFSMVTQGWGGNYYLFTHLWSQLALPYYSGRSGGASRVLHMVQNFQQHGSTPNDDDDELILLRDNWELKSEKKMPGTFFLSLCCATATAAAVAWSPYEVNLSSAFSLTIWFTWTNQPANQLVINAVGLHLLGRMQKSITSAQLGKDGDLRQPVFPINERRAWSLY